MKALCCLLNYEKYCWPGVDALREYGFELKMNPHGRKYTQEELLEDIKDVDAVVADNEPWTEQSFAGAPKLKVIAKVGTGMDNFDLNAAKRHGVVIANCAGVNANSVAEHAVAHLLSVVRHIPTQAYSVQAGGWPRMITHEMAGRTLGIIGFGNIGQAVAEKMSGFDLRIIAWDKFPNTEKAKELGVEMVSFDEIISQSDYMTLSVPLFPDTYHMINDETIAKMKDGVCIVNTARGKVADEAAVERGIASGKISGYGTDVFEDEPPRADNPLFKHEEYCCTPHISGDAYECMANYGRATAQIIIDFFEGKEPKNRQV